VLVIRGARVAAGTDT